ncbi:MAG: hypothetical protein M3N31_04345 [Actinomycetota bacterium]|nr:hypothetical protein [Actinomycetota bacterium]
MADEDPLPRPASDVTEAGVPAVDEVPDEMVRTGDIQESEAPPLERPQGVEEYGTTAAEQQQPETVQDRLAREQPEAGAPVEAGMGSVAVPETPGGVLDPHTDVVGDEDPLPEDTLAPEETALRQTDDLPGATDEPTPGYLEEP